MVEILNPEPVLRPAGYGGQANPNYTNLNVQNLVGLEGQANPNYTNLNVQNLVGLDR